MAIEISGFVTWLKGWFYDKTEVYKKEECYSKTEVNNALSSKLNSNLVTANKMLVTGNNGDVELADKPIMPDVSGKIDTAGTGLSKSGTTLNHSNSVTAQSTAVFKKVKYDGQGHITGTANVESSDLPNHNHSATEVIDETQHNYIGTNANVTQAIINNAIDSYFEYTDGRISSLESIKAIEVVESLDPNPNPSHLGKLYIVSENSKVNVYYVKVGGTSQNPTYSWHKMDTDILDELSINWSEIQNNPFSSSTPSSFANASHNHDTGQVTDPNGHTFIDTVRNATQSTINTAINNTFSDINSELAERKVFYIDQSDLPDGNSDWGYEELYLVWYRDYSYTPFKSEWRIYYWEDGAFGDLVYVSLAEKNEIITSISLVPKSTDANGKIIFYTGDEPS